MTGVVLEKQAVVRKSSPSDVAEALLRGYSRASAGHSRLAEPGRWPGMRGRRLSLTAEPGSSC